MVVLGKLGAPFGVKGWLKVHSYTEDKDGIFDYPLWQIKTSQGWQGFKVEAHKNHHKQPVVQLVGITDREQAQALVKAEIAVPKEALPELEDDELYLFELEGLHVVNTHGECLGKVDKLFDSGGGNQVLALVSCPESIDEQKRLIPYVSNFILEVNLDAGKITVDWESDY